MSTTYVGELYTGTVLATGIFVLIAILLLFFEVIKKTAFTAPLKSDPEKENSLILSWAEEMTKGGSLTDYTRNKFHSEGRKPTRKLGKAQIAGGGK